MSKRAIICFCGKAVPCSRSDCQHSTAVAKRNEVIEKNNSIHRVKKAREALAALQAGEWDEVMQHFCIGCGGAPDCSCMRDD